MNLKYLALIVGGALTLAACSGKPEGTAGSALATAASAETASAPAANDQGKVTLTSRDGKIKINTAGQFTDLLGNADAMPQDVPADKVTLLQKDSVTNTTLLAVNVGSSANPSDFFAKVKANLEADKSLSNLQFGDIAANSMEYGFSQSDEQGNVSLNERCKILAQGDHLYSVCATNADSNQNELAAALQDITAEH